MELHTILGGNGTIGTLLAKELNAYTDRIRVVSRNPKRVNDKDELFAADLSDSSQVDKAVAGSQVVYLVVGFEYTLKIWQRNWPALMRATIDACIKHQAKLVFFDNVYMYDKNAIGNMTENSPLNAPSKKGKVRQQIAEMLMQEVKAGRLNALIARSADFYGPDNDKSVFIETVYKNMVKGKNPNWFMDAGKKHSFTYTPDAAKGTALLGNTPDAFNQVWHLPTHRDPFTVNELIDMLNAGMNLKKKAMVLPMFMIRILGLFIPIMREMPEMMYQNDRDYVFDSTKFETRFHFNPTSYQEGIKQIIARH